MAFLVAAVVLIGIIATLNLLLTMALIRRLRQDEATRSTPTSDSGPPAGSRIPEFTAMAISGEEVTLEAVARTSSVFAFFSTNCSACLPSIPHFVDYVKRRDLDRGQVIAVVGGRREDAADLLAGLDQAATVIMDTEERELARKFSVMAFPTFITTGADGRVETAGAGVGRIPRKA